MALFPMVTGGGSSEISPCYFIGLSNPGFLSKNVTKTLTGTAMSPPTIILNKQCNSITVSFGVNYGFVLRENNGVLSVSQESGTLSNPEQVIAIRGVVSETTTITAQW